MCVRERVFVCYPVFSGRKDLSDVNETFILVPFYLFEVVEVLEVHPHRVLSLQMSKKTTLKHKCLHDYHTRDLHILLRLFCGFLWFSRGFQTLRMFKSYSEMSSVQVLA